MADYAAELVLVLLEELPCRRECDLVDVLVDLLLCHTYTVIDDLEGLCRFIKLHTHRELSKLCIVFARCGQSLHLLSRIDGIRHELAKEDLMV